MKKHLFFLLFVPLCVTGAEYPLTDVNGYQNAYSVPIYDTSVGDTCDTSVTNKWFTAVAQTCLVLPKLDITPTGVTCAGSTSAVNPNDSSQYVIRSVAGLNQLNNASYTQFFVCPGDYSTWGDFTITQDGTSGTRRWLVHCDGVGDACVTSSSSHPYRDKDSGYEQATVLYPNDTLDVNADYWVFSGLKWSAHNEQTDPQNRGVGIDVLDGATGIVFDRNWIDGSTFPGPYSTLTSESGTARAFESGNVTNLRVQFNYAGDCQPDANNDHYAFFFDYTTNEYYFVGNETQNCQGVQNGTNDGGSGGHVFENNDIYYDGARFMACGTANALTPPDNINDIATPDGDCMCGGHPISLKAGGEPGNRMWFVNNRVWGSRNAGWIYVASKGFNDNECGESGKAYGCAIWFGNEHGHTNVVGNILSDAQVAICISDSDNDEQIEIAFEQNLAHDIWAFNRTESSNNEGFVTFYQGRNHSFMFNTFVTEDSSIYLFDGDDDDHEMACNLFIGGSGSSNFTPSSMKVSHNVLVDGVHQVGTNKNPSSGTHTLAAMGLGTYSYYRKLISGPSLINVDNVVPTAGNNPDSYQTHCSGYSRLTGYGDN